MSKLVPLAVKKPKGRKSLNICDKLCLSWHKRVVRPCQLSALSVILKLSPEIESVWLMGWSRCLSLEFPCLRVRNWWDYQSAFSFWKGNSLRRMEPTAGSGCLASVVTTLAPVCVLLLAQALLELGEAWCFGILLALQQQDQVQGRSVLAGQGVLYTTAAETLLPWECGCWG